VMREASPLGASKGLISDLSNNAPSATCRQVALMVCIEVIVTLG